VEKRVCRRKMWSLVRANFSSGRPGYNQLGRTKMKERVCTQEIECRRSRPTTTDRLHPNDEIESSFPELTDRPRINSLGSDQTDDLKISWFGVEVVQGVEQDEGAGQVGRGGEKGNESVRERHRPRIQGCRELFRY